MQFTFNIDMDDIYDSKDFKKRVVQGAVDIVVDNIMSNELSASYISATRDMISEIIKSNSKKICDAVVQEVTDKVLKKKTIVELMPRASDLAKADKENVAYFEELVDKALANKFR